MSRHWSQESDRLLRKAGWREGRDMGELVGHWLKTLTGLGGFAVFEQAEAVLREFGGLRVEQSGPGRDRARVGFRIDPTVAEGESDRFAQFEATAGARLFPLGEVGDAHAFLAVAEDGRVFLLMDDLLMIGSSIEEAIDSLLEGKRPYGTA